MITRWTAWWKQLRRAVSRNEWSVRCLRLPRSRCDASEHGLILVQIDGLARAQLERALSEGRMPFLKMLVEREHYDLHWFYSGLPSSTPSVQGELFFGPRCAVPAFGFRDHRSGELVRMFSRDATRDVQRRLEPQGEGLLLGGSAYCNVYDGGAAESHFCATSLGWDEVMHSANLITLCSFLFWHGWSAVRTLGLLLAEFVLALYGFLRRAMSGRELWQELMMIPARVVVVILMRELATIGAALDAAHGLPIIHLNLLGYDEQSHRRGPASPFAHWTLKGIDGAIHRLWDLVHRSALRHYDVWIYSDHGQEAAIPYEYVAGQRIQAVVAEVVAAHCDEASTGQRTSAAQTTPSRAQWLSAGWIVGRLFGEDVRDVSMSNYGVQVAALGPLGLVYTNRSLSVADRIDIAEQLVRERHVPLACVATAPNTALGITIEGRFELPRQSAEVFGADHPFLTDIGCDLVELCHHADAGEFVVSGWSRHNTSLSFVLQHGAHAGPGVQETGAFVLLPRDVSLPETSKSYLRPADLRQAVMRFLGRSLQKTVGSPRPVFAAATPKLRVMTYNVHACRGMDGKLSPARIARIVAQSGAHIVALQELDVCRARTGFRDQVQDIARHLEMECHFHPAWQLEEEGYGDAILSRFPFRLVKMGQLPAAHQRRETRGAMWVEITLDEQTRFQLLNTHLSIYAGERLLQTKELASDNWLGTARRTGPTIVCGDFNARPTTPSYHLLADQLDDVQSADDAVPPQSTWFSPRPLARIDHIFTTDHFEVCSVQVVQTRLARVASDHLPLMTELRLSARRCAATIGSNRVSTCET